MTTHYKAVFFDLDGTLRLPIPSPTDAFIQFARSQRIHIDDASTRRVKIWAHEYWSQDLLLSAEMARLGEDAFWINYSRQLLETVQATDDIDVRACLVREYFGTDYAPEVQLAPGTPELLARLKSAGYILGVISNRSQPFSNVLTELGIADWFDITLAAGEIGCWKPNPAIFDHARAHFADLTAAECLYIGDNYFADGIGAQSAGMTPIIFDPDALYGDDAFSCVTELSEILAFLEPHPA
ncbi:MAG: HAD family hydrolase [Anaerolineaceae bacterium]|nr:HAD family hydrolase [Anaerolineaceae bacterium]